MNKAVKQYLRQVKKNLFCPRSLSREFLHQLEDDILLFGGNESYEEVAGHFGNPKDVAEDFVSGLNAAEVSRFAFTRLRVLYWILAIFILLFFGFMIPKTIAEVRETYSFLNAHYDEYIVIDESKETPYSQWERTVYNGEDFYWGYYPEEKTWKQIPKPSDNAHEKPVAFGVDMMTETGGIWWEYDAEKNEWVLVEEYFD